MTILLYHCPTAPVDRLWIAQYPRIKDNLYVTFHGSTADLARAKAELMQKYAALDPKERTGFNLKARLAALGEVAPVIDEDDLL